MTGKFLHKIGLYSRPLNNKVGANEQDKYRAQNRKSYYECFFDNFVASNCLAK